MVDTYKIISTSKYSFLFSITWLLRIVRFHNFASHFIWHSLRQLISGVALKARRTNCLCWLKHSILMPHLTGAYRSKR